MLEQIDAATVSRVVVAHEPVWAIGTGLIPTNAAELMAEPGIDGALVGGASLKSDDFAEIVRAAGDS